MERARFSPAPVTHGKSKLLDQVRTAIRALHYSLRTEQTYVHWIKRFILFHNKRHPATMGETGVTAFLNHLAVNCRVAASTQNQALSAILFLYKQVLGNELEWLKDLNRVKRPARLPVVLTRGEVQAVLGQLRGTRWLMASLLYGSGLRVMECLRLRVKDVNFLPWSENTPMPGANGGGSSSFPPATGLRIPTPR